MSFRNPRLWRAGVAALSTALILTSQIGPREQPGLLPDGSFLLNTGWRVKPAGEQIPLDTLPMSCALSKDGKFLVVLNGGYNPPSLSVLDLASRREISRTPVPDAWLGLAFSPDGKKLWAGGGSTAQVLEFSFSEAGELKPTKALNAVPPAERDYRDFIGDLASSPDGRLLYTANVYRDMIVVIDPASGAVVNRFKTGRRRRPYRILFHPNGQSFFVTSWADGTLEHYRASDGALLGSVQIGQHPTDMVWRDRQPTDESDSGENTPAARLFVSAANTNNVYAVSVSDNGALKTAEVINIATSPLHPLGMTPSALALSADRNRLFVVCSDANAVAVVDVSGPGSDVLGFIPVGWYPTAAQALNDGRLIVLNGKGAQSYPNPNGPSPLKPGTQYVARMQTGSASVVPPFSDADLEAYSQRVLSYSPYQDELPDAAPPALPHIEHVLYIVKENRTYDQMLGDIGKGESDPSLCLFPENVTPNQHKLAREFELLDNFYVNSDVSADGHSWATSAIAPDYVQKLWPNQYAGRRKHYDFEGGEPAALPPAGYLWTNAAQRGISFRNYGYWAKNKEKPGADGVQIETVYDPVLRSETNMQYRSFDLDYPDRERAEVYLKDLAQFETSGQMPQLMVLRLGNDHTAGTAAGKLTPFALAADNDYALGMIVEGLSRSKFWSTTAIFVIEDDAQNGPDHIDSHRSPAWVLSPYSRTGKVDSTMYNTASVLRTMELMLGMRPMTHYDAGARPMTTVFQSHSDLTPYIAEKPRVAVDERNPAKSATAARSQRMDFEEADLNDDDELNDILWLALKGTDPPPPRRSFISR